MSDAGSSKVSFNFDSRPFSATCMGSRTSIDLQSCRFSFQSLHRSQQETNLAFFAPMLSHGRFAVVLRPSSTNRFCEINVSRCEADVHRVLWLLKTQSGTLRRLRLSQIAFDSRRQRYPFLRIVYAADFVRALKDELKHLEYLELEDLKGSDYDWGMLPISTVKIKASDRQDIESSLDLWLQSQGKNGEQHD